MSKYAFRNFLDENRGLTFKQGVTRVKGKKNSNPTYKKKPGKRISNRSALGHMTYIFNEWYRTRIAVRYNSKHFVCVNKHVLGKWVAAYIDSGRITEGIAGNNQATLTIKAKKK